MTDKTWNIIFKKTLKLRLKSIYCLNSHHSWFLPEIAWQFKNMAPGSLTLSHKMLGSKSLPLESKQPCDCFAQVTLTSLVSTEKIMQLPLGSPETLARETDSLHVRSPLPWDYRAGNATCRPSWDSGSWPPSQQTAKWVSWHLTTTPWESPSVNGPAEPFPNSWPTCHVQNEMAVLWP